MIAPDIRAWHEKYQQLPNHDRRIIDNAMDAVMKTLRSGGFTPPGDDRAEALVARITQYALEAP